MMKLHQNANNLLKDDYLQMKQKIYLNFSSGLAKLLIMTSLLEISVALLHNNISILISHLIMEVFVLLYMVFMKKSNSQHQEIYITAFVTFGYLPFLCAYYYGDSGYFESALDTFFFTHSFTIIEGLIVSKIPYLAHRTLYRIFGTIFRFLIVPLNQKHLIISQLLLLVVSIYFDRDRENHDKNLFESHFYSQQQLNQFKDLVVNDIPDGILIITSDLQKCLFTNNSLASIIGGEQFCRHYLYQSFEKFVIHESTDSQNVIDSSSKKNLLLILQDYAKSTLEQKKVSFDLAYLNSSSSLISKRIFETKIMPLVWDKQSAIAIIFHDITQQNTILELKIAANIHKERILATVSHELRTPLNSILGMVEIIEGSITDPTTLSRLRICKNSCHLLHGFVNSILDLNLIRANKIKINPERIDFASFLKGVLQLFEFQCTQKAISLTQKIHPSMSKYITTDSNRLSQILINLIGNALKFTFHGGITVKAEERTIEGEEYIEVFVEDTGIGIKKEDQEKLFKMFGKVEHADTVVNKHGVGLGLTICNDLSKLLCRNDKISGVKVRSRINIGSRFSFLIRKNLTDHYPEELNLLSSSFDSCGEVFWESSRIQVYPSSPVKTIQLHQKITSKK